MKDFEPGVAVPLVLKSLEPKEAPDNGYGPAMVFQSNEGAVYLTPFAASQVQDDLHALAVSPGDPIVIVRRGNRFTVQRGGPPANGNGHGNYPNGGGNAPTPPQTPAAAIPQTTQTSKLSGCFCAAIDAVADAQTYADRKGLKVTFTSEDVRAVAISCWIQCSKEGR
jgi:hypothetical protein